MWRATIFAIFYICLIVSPAVKASCLEYGHSCWGAHGKRSIVPAIVGNKAQHALGAKNLRSYEVNVLGDENTNRNMENKYNLDEAVALAENLLRRAVSTEDLPSDLNDSAKTRHPSKFPKYAGDSESKITLRGGESKRNTNRAENQEERDQQSSLTLQQQQQRKYPQHVERWRRFPIYASRPSFGNAPLALTDAAPTLLEIQPRNSETDFVQQFGQLTDGRLGESGVFYDVL